MAKGRDDLVVVIMAGGAGTRFWPLSTPELPKQFMKAFGETSFYRQAVERARRLVPWDRILVLTHHGFLGMARDQAPEMPPDHVIGEPVRRDTAAAVTLAAVIVEELWPDAVCVITPADHVVRDVEAFADTVDAAVARARQGGLGTFGIRPTFPATAYGYLHVQEPDPSGDHPRVRPLQRFVEKPDLEKAREFISRDDHFWNSGIFVWRTRTILEALKAHLPDLVRQLSPVPGFLGQPTFLQQLKLALEPVQKISIDFGVMEKAEDVWMVEASFDWSDVGGWVAALDLVEPDGDGNRIRGEVVAGNARENLILSDEPGKTVICSGVDGLIVACTREGTLISTREAVETIKPLVEKVVDSPDRSAREDHRPWGSYEVLSDRPDHKVKRIIVHPGQRLSLQRHQKRSEHWHVVSGLARVTRDEDVIDVREGEAIDIPRGAWHRVMNPTEEPLVFIEVQRGTYFGEDDIERQADDYGRVEAT